jgi:pimeloyl-ACP methyl ester carboxylesterase
MLNPEHILQLLIGSSMGAWMSLLLALARPERVAGIVTISAAVGFTDRFEQIIPANVSVLGHSPNTCCAVTRCVRLWRSNRGAVDSGCVHYTTTPGRRGARVQYAREHSTNLHTMSSDTVALHQ